MRPRKWEVTITEDKTIALWRLQTYIVVCCFAVTILTGAILELLASNPDGLALAVVGLVLCLILEALIPAGRLLRLYSVRRIDKP